MELGVIVILSRPEPNFERSTPVPAGRLVVSPIFSIASPLTAFTNTNGENPSVLMVAAVTASLPLRVTVPTSFAFPFTTCSTYTSVATPASPVSVRIGLLKVRFTFAFCLTAISLPSSSKCISYTAASSTVRLCASIHAPSSASTF